MLKGITNQKSKLNIILWLILLVSFKSVLGLVTPDNRDLERKIEDHYQLATDFDGTYAYLPTSVNFAFHKTAKGHDDIVTDDLLKLIGKEFQKRYKEQKKFVQVEVIKRKGKKRVVFNLINQDEFKRRKKKKKNVFYLQLFDSSDLREVPDPDFSFSEKSFMRAIDDSLLRQDIESGVEEREVLEKVNKLRSRGVHLKRALNFVTARGHSPKGFAEAINFLSRNELELMDANVYNLSNHTHCPFPSRYTIPQKKGIVVASILGKLKSKKVVPMDSNTPKIKNPCLKKGDPKYKMNYKVFEFFDDDKDNVMGGG